LGLRKLVPLPLGFSAGSAPHTVAIDGTPAFAPLVCYEAIFPRALIDREDRPDWLLNVTNDGWFGNTAGPTSTSSRPASGPSRRGWRWCAPPIPASRR
jgi:apolipoprotein N-acyltransferase